MVIENMSVPCQSIPTTTQTLSTYSYKVHISKIINYVKFHLTLRSNLNFSSWACPQSQPFTNDVKNTARISKYAEQEQYRDVLQRIPTETCVLDKPPGESNMVSSLGTCPNIFCIVQNPIIHFFYSTCIYQYDIFSSMINLVTLDCRFNNTVPLVLTLWLRFDEIETARFPPDFCYQPDLFSIKFQRDVFKCQMYENTGISHISTRKKTNSQ